MTLTLFGTLNAHISFNVHYTVMYFNVSIIYIATLYCSIVICHCTFVDNMPINSIVFVL